MRLALGDDHGVWAAGARDYLQRGKPDIALTDSRADVVVTDSEMSATAPDDAWHLTDAAGAPLTNSPWVRDAVARRTPVEIQLRSRSLVLAAGRTDVRRNISATVEVALRSAGPLIEMAAAAAVPVTAAVERRPATAVSAGAAAFRGQSAFAGRVARAAATYRQWGIARLPAGSVDALLTGTPGDCRDLTWHSPEPNRFWADPCVVADDMGCWVFVEELDRTTGRGHIRAVRWEGSDLVPGGIVHSSHHHMSFPQVQFTGGRWLATVETCAATNPVLTFDRPGEPWRLASDLPALPPHLADPVLVIGADGLPQRVVATDAQTSPDTNYVEHVRDGDRWVRTPSATYVDITTARGGGTRLPEVRAVQDCATVYGRALCLVPTRDWHGTVYGDPLAVLSGSDVDGDWTAGGVHTLTWTPDQEQVWIDGWRRRPAVTGGYRRWVERRHPRECDGT